MYRTSFGLSTRLEFDASNNIIKFKILYNKDYPNAIENVVFKLDFFYSHI